MAKRRGCHDDSRLRWLFHFARLAGGGVDTFSGWWKFAVSGVDVGRAIVARVIFWRRLCCVLVFVLFAPFAVHASSNSSFDNALNSCQNYSLVAHYGAGVTGETCVVNASNHSVDKAGTLGNGVSRPGTPSDSWGSWAFSGDVPESPSTCSAAISSASLYMSGKVLASSTGCQAGKDPSSGASLSCGMTYTPVSPPVVNPYSGSWQTYVTAAPTGNACDATADHSVKDATGAIEVPTTAADSAVASPTTTPPKVCGGGSCYDPGSDQYCATSGGEQVCVSGATARGAAGGCASGGDGTLCAGQTPPTPSPSNVSDPATQIVASDKTTQADPTTGTPVTVTANTYATSPGATSSGQKTGDSGPAAASTAPSVDNGSYSGGGDCNTPPVCNGDVVMCGASRTQWATSCAQLSWAKDHGLDEKNQKYADSGCVTPPGCSGDEVMCAVARNTWAEKCATSGDGSAPPAENTLTAADVSNPDQEVDDTGSLDKSGFGWGSSCPFHDLQIPMPGGAVFSLSFQPVCDYGLAMKAFILICAGLTCAGILGGFSLRGVTGAS